MNGFLYYRGGETISPFEIEEAVQQHPSIKEVLAFSAPHQQVIHIYILIHRSLCID
jgi:acyl-CoA synthetase (AMP-forming)/AMP-acid ligase II